MARLAVGRVIWLSSSPPVGRGGEEEREEGGEEVSIASSKILFGLKLKLKLELEKKLVGQGVESCGLNNPITPYHTSQRGRVRC